MNDLSEPPVELLRGASLFLDFDGTLVDLALAPDAIEVAPETRELLARLDRCLEGRVAILTGRSLDDLTAHLHPVGINAAGSHGLERRGVAGVVQARPQGLDDAIEALRQLQTDFAGVLIEEKPLGVAVHYRAAPGAEDACRVAATAAAERAGMALQPGKMVFELKPAGGHKGSALRQFMAEAPFRSTRPVFIGDDLTDEHGFEAARALSGAGVLVGEARATAASYRLPGVRSVHRWLAAACEALA